MLMHVFMSVHVSPGRTLKQVRAPEMVVSLRRGWQTEEPAPFNIRRESEQQRLPCVSTGKFPSSSIFLLLSSAAVTRGSRLLCLFFFWSGSKHERTDAPKKEKDKQVSRTRS